MLFSAQVIIKEKKSLKEVCNLKTDLTNILFRRTINSHEIIKILLL